MSLKVMTYNLLNGGAGREAMIVSVIQAAMPHVVVLEEVYSAAFVQQLAAELRMNFFFGPGNARRHVALLSHFPILSAHSHHPFPPIRRNVVEACIEYAPGARLRVIGVHPVANLWLPFECWRTWEAGFITKLLQKDPGQPGLIAGDFNAIAPGDAIQIDTMPAWLKWVLRSQRGRAYPFSIQAYRDAGLLDCYRHLHPTDPGYTLPAKSPNARLDYIFANPALAPFLTTCRVVREPEVVFQASDHLPVAAEFNLKYAYFITEKLPGLFAQQPRQFSFSSPLVRT